MPALYLLPHNISSYERSNPMTNIKQEFKSPSFSYRGKPFWAWNGELRSEELIRQTKIMKEMGLGGYFMHSRVGLITEYLGEEWFDMINKVADSAEQEGMEAWLYDEDRWPSGSAGGKATIDPKYRMKSLYVYVLPPEKFQATKDTYQLFLAKMDGINLWAYKEIANDTVDISTALAQFASELSLEEAALPGEWKILRFTIELDPCNSTYNGSTYLNTLSLEATQNFINTTHEEYVRHCGDRLGRSIKGIFTDEPHNGHCMDNLKEHDGVLSCAMCWTDDLFDEFQERYGYDARPIIPELFFRLKGKKVSPIKLHYIDLSNNLFLERFVKPINDWCNDHHMILTGHFLHENSLMNQTVPHGSLMRGYEFMGYPGVDYLGSGFEPWIVKQLASVARQLDKKWLLSELYACNGWEFNFKGHKTVGDWQTLLGINLRCQHLSWYSMEGSSKRDYPASILHQSPWYPYYSTVEDYFARFGLVISEGKPACDVLVINPIESIWCQAYIGWADWIFNASPDVEPYEERYRKLCFMLLSNQIDFDYGEEEMMARMSAVEQDSDGNALLRIGKQCYRTVLVCNMLTIRPSTLALLRQFMELGGSVIFAGDVPTYTDAVPSDAARHLSTRGICVPFEEEAIVSAIRETSQEFISVINENGKVANDIYTQVRKDFNGNGYAIVLLNTDRNCPKNNLTLSLKVPSGYQVQEWNLENGTCWDAEKLSCQSEEYLTISFSLEAAGTRCFVLSTAKERLPELMEYETISETVIRDDFTYHMNEKNACVLNQVKWRWQGDVFSEEKDVLEADDDIRDSIGMEHRSGEMLQPWYTKLYANKYYGKLELQYKFEIETLPEGDVYLAGERPETNHYNINGVALTSEDINDFWIDECFKKMKIPAGALKLGQNFVTVQVDFMRTTNIEALYLIGDFGISLHGRHCTLTKLPQVIGCQNYENYNLPFYTGAMTYQLTPNQYKDMLDNSQGDRIVLSPVNFTGSCVIVSFENKTQVLGWDPYEADVTEAVKALKPINVTIVGTRKNLFECEYEEKTEKYKRIDSGLRGIALKKQIIK